MSLLSASDIASITDTVTSSFDAQINVQRSTAVIDAFGSLENTLSTVGTFMVNFYRPNASQLAKYADVIKSREAIMLRFARTNDIREGDIINYNGKSFVVQSVVGEPSYTFDSNALLVVIS